MKSGGHRKAVMRKGLDTLPIKWEGLPIKQTWRQFIERDDIDLIDTGMPNNVHAEMAIGAVEAGKHL